MSNMKEKLHTGELYFPGDEEIIKEQVKCQDLLCEYNLTKPSEAEKRTTLLKQMLGDCGEGVYIEAPFYAKNPCRVMREVGEHDREFYFRDRRIDWDHI